MQPTTCANTQDPTQTLVRVPNTVQLKSIFKKLHCNKKKNGGGGGGTDLRTVSLLVVGELLLKGAVDDVGEAVLLWSGEGGVLGVGGDRSGEGQGVRGGGDEEEEEEEEGRHWRGGGERLLGGGHHSSVAMDVG